MLRTLKNFRQVDTEEQEDALTALKVTTMGNLAAAYIQTQQYPEAIRQCEAALTLDPDNGKIWMRKARALSLNGDYAHAVLNLDVVRYRCPAGRLLVPGCGCSCQVSSRGILHQRAEGRALGLQLDFLVCCVCRACQSHCQIRGHKQRGTCRNTWLCCAAPQQHGRACC